MILETYLQEIQDAEINTGDHMKCEICGREVVIKRAGQGPLICCGEEMIKIESVQEAGFSKYPKGWTQASVKKFAQTLMKGHKGNVLSKDFFNVCMKSVKKKLQDPEGFCAAVKDEATGSTFWRGKGKSLKKVKADVRKHKNV